MQSPENSLRYFCKFKLWIIFVYELGSLSLEDEVALFLKEFRNDNWRLDMFVKAYSSFHTLSYFLEGFISKQTAIYFHVKFSQSL